MQLDERRLVAALPGRAKMSFRAPSMSTVAKVVGRLKGKNVTEIKITTINQMATNYPEGIGQLVLANVLTYFYCRKCAEAMF